MDILERLESCELCPHRCRVNRTRGETGKCATGRFASVASFGPHHGEEPPLVGKGGSGTVFFSGCNLACVYCQNYDISQRPSGGEVTEQSLAETLLYLQGAGCVNVNFVSPTHVMPQAVAALEIARNKGLVVPAVYNTGGYELPEVVASLAGKIEIYMPDAKYSDDENALKYSGARNYFENWKASLKEMHRQVGDLVVEDGVARKGLLVRHLVLPDGLAGSRRIIDFIADEVSKDTCVNVMGQYRPCFKASSYEILSRRPTYEEIAEVREYAASRGLRLAR